MSDDLKNYPATLLAFLYAVTYDATVNMEFHSDSLAVMEKFKLSPAAQDALNAMADHKDGSEAEKTTAVQGLMTVLCQEILADEYAKIW